MAVVRVDSRGRMTIPKELGVRVTTAVIISAGPSLLETSFQKHLILQLRIGWRLRRVDPGGTINPFFSA